MYSLKKFILPIILFICAVIIILAAFLLSQKHGSFTVSVVDAYTNMPLNNALIIIAESDSSFTTDKNGKAFCSNIRFDNDSQFKELQKSNSGTVTILCYKDGYMDFVLFNAAVSDVGVGEKTLYMFPFGSENERSFIAMNETPDDEFAKKLLEKYSSKYLSINTD